MHCLDSIFHVCLFYLFAYANILLMKLVINRNNGRTHPHNHRLRNQVLVIYAHINLLKPTRYVMHQEV